jgi:predicted O-methyltransferase YrrM
MEPEAVLKQIEDAAPSEGWPIIGPTRGMILDDVVQEHRPSRILEVGTLVGYSAIRMSRHLKKGQKITCVEVSEKMARTARSNLAKAGLSDRAEIIVGDAKKVLPTLSGSFDMVFLDAIKDDYLNYLKSIEKLLHRGSVIVADNVKSSAENVSGYLDYVRNSGKYTSRYWEPKEHMQYVSGAIGSDAVEISVKL